MTHRLPRRSLLCLILFAAACLTTWLATTHRDSQEKEAQATHRSHLQKQATRENEARRLQAQQADHDLLASVLLSGHLHPFDPEVGRQQLEQILRQLPIGNLTYEFGPPTRAQTEGPSLYYRSLKISVSILHEAVFLALLERIVSTSPALVRLKQCQLKPAGIPDIPLMSLQAECELDWVTR